MSIRLGASHDPEADAVLLAEMLTMEMNAWPASARLVIDDYQALAVSNACERFVETLIHQSPLRLLIAGRKRPAWAHSRLRLYGELLEIRGDELLMTADEARRVLTPIADYRQCAELVDLCHGWPAVLDLAARSRVSLPKNVLPPDLYDYFAEEMFQSSPPELQRLLCQISAAPRITRELLRSLGSTDALALADAAETRGFFFSSELSEFSLHPLLRAFLQQRLDEHHDRVDLVTDLAQALLDSQSWDDVWKLIQEQRRPDLLPRLIETSLPTLLDGSRVPSISSWIQYALEHAIVSPIIDLAEAEILFLAGDHVKAYSLAVQSSRRLLSTSPLYWRTHALAARTAFFIDQPTTANAHARLARSACGDSDALRHCLWIQYVCAHEEESDDRLTILSELEQSSDGSINIDARIAQAKLAASDLLGFPDIVAAHSEFNRIIPLLERAHPQVRAALLTTQGEHFTHLARYRDADLAFASAQKLHEEYGFDLVLPNIFLSRAVSNIGLRRYRHATMLLDALDESKLLLRASTSTYARALRRLLSYLTNSRNHLACELAVDERSSRYAHGFALAVEALLSASLQCSSDAISFAMRADDITRSSEVSVLTSYVRAIVADIEGSSDSVSELKASHELARRLGQWNPFVWSYRVYPQLLSLTSAVPELLPYISPIITRACDSKLATHYGIPLSDGDGVAFQSDLLSPRETEVLRLVAEGLTNDDIAHRLFISSVTVKVHLRHIYRKLGVRNRTEATRHALFSD